MSEKPRQAFDDEPRDRGMPPPAPPSRVTNVLLFRPGERFHSLPDSPYKNAERDA